MSGLPSEFDLFFDLKQREQLTSWLIDRASDVSLAVGMMLLHKTPLTEDETSELAKLKAVISKLEDVR
jgi:hypothetical protein